MPKLTVIVPVYNEAQHLAEVLKFLFETPCPLEREWIIVDDCSSDQSRGILRQMQTEHPFVLIEHPENLGKGYAIRSAIQRASGHFIQIQDADFEYDPRDIPQLLEPLLRGEADIVYGSRFKKNVPQVHRTYHYFVNRLLTVISNLLSGMYLTDMETCYKIFPSDLMKSMNLRSKRFGIEVELTAYAAKTSARIFELPIRYYPRTQLQGKKINWKDGIAALVHLVRFNLFTPLKVAFTELPKRYQPREMLRPLSFQYQD